MTASDKSNPFDAYDVEDDFIPTQADADQAMPKPQPVLPEVAADPESDNPFDAYDEQPKAEEGDLAKSLGEDGFFDIYDTYLKQPQTGPVPPVEDSFGDLQQYKEFGKGIPKGVGTIASSAMRGAAPIEDPATWDAARSVAEGFTKFMPDLERAKDMSDSEFADLIGRADQETMGVGTLVQQSATALRQGTATIDDIKKQYPPPSYERRRADELALYKAADAVDRNADILPAAPGYEQAIGRQLGEGTGTLIGGVALSWVNPALGATAFTASGSGEAMQRAVEWDKADRAKGGKGLTADEIFKVGLLGTAPGATDIVPVETLLRGLKIPAAWRKPIAERIARVGGQAFIEGGQEGLQQFMQNLIASGYDPSQDLGADVPGSAGLGGGVGAIAQTAKEVFSILMPGRTREAKVNTGTKTDATEASATEQAAPEATAPTPPPTEPDSATITPIRPGVSSAEPTPEAKRAMDAVASELDGLTDLDEGDGLAETIAAAQRNRVAKDPAAAEKSAKAKADRAVATAKGGAATTPTLPGLSDIGAAILSATPEKPAPKTKAAPAAKQAAAATETGAQAAPAPEAPKTREDAERRLQGFEIEREADMQTIQSLREEMKGLKRGTAVYKAANDKIQNLSERIRQRTADIKQAETEVDSFDAGPTGQETGQAETTATEQAPATVAETETVQPDKEAVATFKTAKGSTYAVQSDGTTVRNKAARNDPGHEGDSGIKTKSDLTVYVTKDDVNNLGEFQAIGDSKKAIVRRGNQIGIRYVDGKGAGKFERRTLTDFQTEPAVGLIPVETWKDGTVVHFGNEIVEVSKPGLYTESSGQLSLVPEVTTKQRLDAQSAKPITGGNAPMDIGMFGSGAAQTDLLDKLKQPAVKLTPPAPAPAQPSPKYKAKREADIRGSVRKTADAVAGTYRRHYNKLKRARKPVSLISFLTSQGGINDVGGDLRGMDANKRIGLIRAQGKGLDPDKAREAAVQAGYLADAQYENETTSTVSDLFEAIREELSGKPGYAVADRSYTRDLESAKSAADSADRLLNDWEDEISNFFVANDLDANLTPEEMLTVAQALDQMVDVSAEERANAIDNLVDGIYSREYDQEASDAETDTGRDQADSAESESASGIGERAADEGVPFFEGPQPGEDGTAGPEATGIEADLRSRFYDLLESKARRKDWADTLGLDEDQLSFLIQDGLQNGWLRTDSNGVVRRVNERHRPARPDRTQTQAEPVLAALDAPPPRPKLSLAPQTRAAIEAKRASVGETPAERSKRLNKPFDAQPQTTQWLGFPTTTEFTANVEHIAAKRAAKDGANHPLANPDNVRAHIETVLANANFAFHYKEENGWTLVVPQKNGEDWYVGLDERLERGRIYIRTAFIANKGKTQRAINQAVRDYGPAEAMKWKKDLSALREIQSLVRPAPGEGLDPSVQQLKAALKKSQDELASVQQAVQVAGSFNKVVESVQHPEVVARSEAYGTINDGKVYVAHESATKKIRQTLKRHVGMVPANADLMWMEKIIPIAGDTKHVLVHFRTLRGDLQPVRLPKAGITGHRAVFLPWLNGIAFFRFGPTIGAVEQETLAGEVWHELIHLLRARNLLGQDLWSRLVQFARHDLNVLNLPAREFMRSIGNPSWAINKEGVTLGDYYTQRARDEKYSVERAEEILDQEAVAHLSELVYHNVLTPAQISEVQDIFDLIGAQTFGRGAMTLEPGDPLYDVAYQANPEFRGAIQASRPPLDMSPEARKARAEEMGFDTSRVYYRGSNRPIDDGRFTANSDPDEPLGSGVFVSADPEFASGFAWDIPTAFKYQDVSRRQGEEVAGFLNNGNVAPLYIRGPIADMDLYRKLGRSGLIEQGYTGVRRTDYDIIVFSPSNIRSTSAAFDPALDGENGLLYAMGSSRPPLDMSPEARRERARAQGRTVLAYRGLRLPYSDAVAKKLEYQFFTRDPGVASGYAGEPAKTNISGNVVPVLLRMGKNLEIDVQGSAWDNIAPESLPPEVFANALIHASERRPWKGDYEAEKEIAASLGFADEFRYAAILDTDDVALAAKEAGYDSLTLTNVIDNLNSFDDTTVSTIDVVFDPKDIRSVNAAMDPALDQEGGILYALGAPPSTPKPKPLLEIMAGLRDSVGLTTVQQLRGLTVGVRDSRNRFRQLVRLTPNSRGMAAEVTGQYDRKGGVAYIRSPSDMVTVSHEAAHKMEDKFGDGLEAVKQAHAAELVPLSKGGGPSLSEGFGDWFSSYVMNPSAAKTQAPNFYDAFEDFLDAENPGMLEGLQQAQADFRVYDMAAPEGRAIADVATGAPISKANVAGRLAAGQGRKLVRATSAALRGQWNRAYQEMGEPPQVMDFIGRMMIGSFTDRAHPIRVMVKKMLKLADANGVRDANGRKITLKVWDNAYKIARMIPGAYKSGHMFLVNGVPTYGGFEAEGPSLQQAIDLAMSAQAKGLQNKSRRWRWNKEALDTFGAYLISHRAIAEYERWEAAIEKRRQLTETIDQASEMRRGATETLRKVEAQSATRKKRLAQAQGRLAQIDKEITWERGRVDTWAKSRSPQAKARLTEALSGIRRFDNERADIIGKIPTLESEIADRQDRIDRLQSAIGGLAQVIEASKKELDLVNKYEPNRRPTDKSKDAHIATKAALEQQYPDFLKAQKMVAEWQRRLLTYEFDAGRWTPEVYAKLLERADWYVPFMRRMDEPDTGPSEAARAWGDKVFSTKTGGIKKFRQAPRFRGSDRQIINPLESLTERAYHTGIATMFNDMTRSLADLAEKVGPGGEQIAARVRRADMLAAVDGSFKELEEIAIAQGMDVYEAHMMVQRFEQDFSDSELELLWSPNRIGPGKVLTVPLWEGGKRNMVRLNDPELMESVFTSMQGLSSSQLNLVTRLLGVPSRALSRGTVTHIAYVIPNLARDAVLASIYTGSLPGWTQLKGIYYELGESRGGAWLLKKLGIEPPKIASTYAASSGIMGGQMTASSNEIMDKSNLRDLRYHGFHFGNWRQGINPFSDKNWAATFAEGSETATRLGVFAHALKRAKAAGMADAEAIQEAAFTSRDMIDFDRRGSKMHAVAHVVSFLNSAIQGLSVANRKLFTAESDRGSAYLEAMKMLVKGERGQLSVDDQKSLASAARVVVLGSIVSVFFLIMHWLYADDEEYKEIMEESKWRDMPVRYLSPWTGKMEWGRVPRPFEAAFPGNVLIAAYDYQSGRDPRFGERVRDAAIQNIVPPYTPQFVTTIGGMVYNTDGFGNPIVNMGQNGLEPYLQFDQYSSAFAKRLAFESSKIGVEMSPEKIDYALRMGGYWGQDLQLLSNKIAGDDKPGIEDEFLVGPLAKRLSTDLSRSSAGKAEFWNLMQQGSGEYTRAARSYKEFLESEANMPITAKEYLNTLDEEKRAYALLKTHFEGKGAIIRLHPLQRAESTMKIMREMANEVRALKGFKVGEGDEATTLAVSSLHSSELRQMLGMLQTWEAANALIAIGHDQWSMRQPFDTQLVWNEIEASSPELAEELKRRIEKKKVESYEVVRDAWPRIRDELNANAETLTEDDITQELDQELAN